jgi:predicted kinase
MSGESGTGKSTLARAIGASTGGVVIDKDVVKARMLTNRPRDEYLPEALEYIRS